MIKIIINMFFLVALLITNQSAVAMSIYKCKRSNGTISYSQSPCKEGETLIRKKDLSKRLGNNAQKAKDKLEKIIRRKNKKQDLREQKERKRRYKKNRFSDSNNDRTSETETNETSSNQESSNTEKSAESSAASYEEEPTIATENSDNSSTEPTVNQLAVRSDTSLPKTDEFTETESSNNSEEGVTESLNEIDNNVDGGVTDTATQPSAPLENDNTSTDNTADTTDTSAPSSGGGSPNQPATQTITSTGKLFGPIEFEIISWPLTKAYPGIEYNIRLGVIGGQYPYLYKLDQSPDGMSINQYTGEIKWLPAHSLENSSVNVVASVTDSTGGTIKQSFSINVTKSGIYFVSPNGSDSSGNGSIGKPWKTMDTAISRAGVDGILYLRGGLYKGAFTLDKSDSNKWIAYPGEKPVIDLNLSTLWPVTNFGYIDGLEIINARRWGFAFTGEDNWIFRRNHMHHLYDDSDRENPSFIFFKNEGGPQNRAHQNIVIQDNVFHDLFDRGSGINGDIDGSNHGGSSIMYDVYQSLYEDNEAYNIDGSGVKDKDHGQFNTFRGNYLHDNSKEAFALSNQGYGNNIEILYNVFDGTVIFGQVKAELSNVLFRHNTVKGQIMHIDALAVGQEKTIVFIDNIITIKKADVAAFVDRADGYTNDGIPYLGADDADGINFTSSVLYRDNNVIDYEEKYIAGWGWGDNNRTLAEWQNLGYDVNSIFADPQLNDPSSADYRPKASSPACGKALDGGDIGALRCMK